MNTTFLLLIYSVLIIGSSLLGGWLPSLIKLTHRRMQLMLSLIGGLMLGVAVFHLFPHSLAHLQVDSAVIWLMGGILLMFFMLRVFHFHHHGEFEGDADEEHHDHDHCHSHSHTHGEHAPAKHYLSWVGVFVGLAVHTAIDGVALAAAMAAADSESESFVPVGLATFLAIALHKPFDALSITSLMAAGGWSPKIRLIVNFGFASMCPLGAFLFYLGFAGEGTAVSCTLALSAGVFLCIALSDLLPEIQFHTHDRLKLTCMLMLGIAMAYAIHLIEPHHDHGSGGGHGHSDHGHEHHGHDH